MSALNASDLRRIFETLDRNGDGFVSMEELNCLLQSTGVELALEDLESSVGKSRLDLNEFLSLYQSLSERNDGESRGGVKEEEEEEEVESDLLDAFQVFDVNGDGFITCDELQKVLTRLGLWDERGGRDCSLMIGAFDSDLDGQLDFQEFKNMMMLSANSP